MTRSLYTKFLLGYLVFGLLGFIFIATMSSEITYQYLLEEKSDSLYDEANLLASTYSDIYQGKNISLSTANPQLQAVATYLKAGLGHQSERQRRCGDCPSLPYRHRHRWF